jgi:2-keto-4-pentenoate hydratase
MKPWEDPRVERGMKEQFAKRRARIEAGEKPLGWKVGFGAPAAMKNLGTTAPLLGYLMQRALVAPGGTVSLSGWSKPVAEPEIFVRMARDLPAGGSREDAAAAIGALGPAIELADLNPAPTAENLSDVLAGDIYQRHVVLGEKTRAGSGTDGLLCRIERRGAEAARTDDPQAATGKIVDTVRHVADMLAAFGEKLRAGDVIITGSVVPPIFVEPDETDFAFELQPVGKVSVRFSRE